LITSSECFLNGREEFGIFAVLGPLIQKPLGISMQLPRRKMFENAREQNGAMVFAALEAN
jgi:hypothetical protein